VVIGLLLAGRQQLGIDMAEIGAAVIVLLYIRGPVAQIAAALPLFDQARVSFQRIAELSAELNQHEPNLTIEASSSSAAAKHIVSIELRGVTYAFPAKEGSKPFVLGPIDLAVAAGELLFIVGENGSGKTTLVKLLLGLYEPREGAIFLNGEPVTATTRDDYRQLFTTVFADYYLFDDLIYGGALPAEALPYLEKLDIAHSVTVKDRHFSTTDLSTGQRKRLALVHAYLEKRPVIVTDEWAADQDPAFRKIFYTELLPELKREGKTLIVVSHDDRYFDVADRIVRMENGRIIEDRKVTRPALVAGDAT
jgi:putative ATP-binding cassette transporter